MTAPGCDPGPVPEVHPERAPLRLATMISGVLTLETTVWIQVTWLIVVAVVVAALALQDWRADAVPGPGTARQPAD